MTKNDFDQFIDDHSLYSFDGLISVTLADGTNHRAIWITTLPELGESADGNFKGKPEIQSFYLFESNQYVCWYPAQIEKLECIQERYLKRLERLRIMSKHHSSHTGSAKP